MKINYIKISNILSFKHCEDLNSCNAIEFTAKETDDNLHIMIGPNGSGKSNLLEIVNQLFKNILFKRCQFNKTNFLSRSSDINFEKNKKKILQVENQNVSNLNKNWNCKDKNQSISISLSLNENDHENIAFVVENANKIDEYFQTYAEINPNFSSLIGDDIYDFKKSIKLKDLEFIFTRSGEGDQFSVQLSTQNNVTNFIKNYLEFFEFLQEIIEIHNLSEGESNQWGFLKNTFALIGCYRNYNTVSPTYSANNKNETDVYKGLHNEFLQDNTLQSRNDEPVVFKLIKHKLAYKGFQLHEDDKKKSEIVPSLYDTSLYKSINNLLKEFLNLELSIDPPDSSNWTFTFNIKKNDETINFQNLSAGQKGIIHLIFSLYGYDIEHGLIVIDEPELHLHPQLQKKYLEIIEQESLQRDIQFVIATHSPIFVSEKTIKNIQRFYFDEQGQTSQIITPSITEDDKFLVQILHYTNTSKIFFVNKVILVEGEGDEYFFEFYINSLKDNQSNKNIGDYEILNIGGKGSQDKWRIFLEKWGLKVNFIGDWDNVKKMSLIDKDWKTKINTNREGKNKKSYPVIIKLLQTEDSTRYNDLTTKITTKRNDDIYILQKGELEDYLGIEKGLGNIIEYCNGFDSKSLKDKTEIDEIINKIFSPNPPQSPSSTPK